MALTLWQQPSSSTWRALCGVQNVAEAELPDLGCVGRWAKLGLSYRESPMIVKIDAAYVPQHGAVLAAACILRASIPIHSPPVGDPTGTARADATRTRYNAIISVCRHRRYEPAATAMAWAVPWCNILQLLATLSVASYLRKKLDVRDSPPPLATH